MAVERMKLMNVVLPKKDAHNVLTELVLYERVELVDAKQTIDETNFLLSTSLENAEVIQELNEIKTYEPQADSSELSNLLMKLLEGTDIKPRIYKHLQFDREILNSLLKDVSELNKRYDALTTESLKLEPLAILAELGLDIPLKELYSMEYLSAVIGFVGSVNYQRLKLNAENIPPIFVHLGSWKKQELCLFTYPKSMEVETRRILQSVVFEEISIDQDYLSTPILSVPERLGKIQQELKDISQKKHHLLQEDRSQIDALYTRLQLEERIDQLTPLLGESPNYVYLSMWVPAKNLARVKARIEGITTGIIGSMGSIQAQGLGDPPTSLKNGRFFRPFESLVFLYGIPNYREIDPTPFFALAYMLLFGAMFGDLGQGLLIFLTGFLLVSVKHKEYGRLFMRIGSASMLFGFFYDSVFGFEGVLSRLIPLPIFFHPFEETNLVLVAAIIVGLFLLSVGYIYGILNKYRLGEYAEMYFGKTGIAGFGLFLSILLKVGGMVLKPLVSGFLSTLLIILFSLLIMVKEPLWNLISREEHLIDGSLGEYITEQIFEMIETFLSMISNSLSFVRVGAFALSHVGLFVAFHAIAEMIGGPAGTIGMAILGNIVVIALEGLVVFIQGLRLLFYELFSKYYIGDGRAFESIILEEK